MATIMPSAPTSSASFATMSTSTRSPRLADTSLSIVADAVAITKEVSEMLARVPYVKAVAGIVLQVLRIRDELKSNEERSRDLIDSIARRSITLFQCLKKIAQSDAGDSLEELKSDLLEYTQLLEDIYAGLSHLTSKGTRARIARLLNRREFADRMRKYEARIKEFDESFKNNRLISMEVQMTNISNRTLTAAPSSRILQKPQLPPKPQFVYGRSEEIEAIVTSLTSQETGRVAILGPGGMGKTTVAACVMHDDRVASHYSRRIFISCDGVTSLELLLVSLASTLHIASKQQDSSLYIAVLEELGRVTTLLCLDNFESPWEPPATRPSIEELLVQIAAIATLGLLVTMRGIQYPASSAIAWSKPLPQSLQSIELDAAADMFERISGKRDDFALKLINAVDQLPLAVSLLAQLVSEEDETTEVVWTKWITRRDRTRMLENSGHDRLSNLDVSIQLSVDSPRMTPTARIVLGLLALLPDGFPDILDTKAKLQNHLSDLAFNDGLTALKRVALAYKDEPTYDQSRIRLLSPVRDFVLGNNKLHPPPSMRQGLFEFYLELMTTGRDYTSTDNRRTVSPELLNLYAMLKHARANGLTSDHLCEASCCYTRWMSYIGTYSDEVIRWVLQAGELTIGEEGDCNQCIGEVYMRQYQLDEAEKTFERAAELHRQAHDVLGEANDLKNLGQLYMRRGQLEEAEKMFERAAELHRLAQDVLGEGNDLQNLGKVYMRRDQLEEAEKMFERAAELHRLAQDVLGEGNDLQNLGEVYMRQYQLDEAEKAFERAAELHRLAQDVLGEGNDLQNLGKVYMRRDQLEEAEKMFERAAELHRLAQDVLGEGNDLQNLGEVYMRQYQLDEAEKAFERAAELHRLAHDVLGEGNDLTNRGQLYMRRDQLEDAEKSFERAAELHRQAQDVLGEGNDLQKLGELYMRRGQLEDAEKMLERAAELHRQAQDVLGGGNDLQDLGELYMRRDQLEEAEKTFERAAELHRQAQDVLGEGNNLLNLGKVYMRQDQVDEAEKTFERAAELHRQAQDMLGEGNDLRNLGELYMRRGQLEEAKNLFEQAAELHRQAHSVLGEGNDLQNLGELYMQQDRLDEAEKSFKRAAELHRRAQDVHAEGYDLECLREIYTMRQSQLDNLKADDILEEV